MCSMTRVRVLLALFAAGNLVQLPLCEGGDFQNATNSSWPFYVKEALLKKGGGHIAVQRQFSVSPHLTVCL